MNRNTGLPLTVGCTMLAFLVGCSADYYYGQGNKAQEQGQYEKAVENFQTAVDKDSSKPEYRQALDSAKQKAAAGLLAEATSLANAADLVKALAKAEQAGHYDPDNAQATALAADLRQRLAVQFVADATQLANAADLSPALAKAEQALRYDAINPQALALAADLRQRIDAADQKRQQALALAGQGQFDQAMAQLQQALTENRSMPTGQADLTRIRQMASAYWASQAQERFNRGETELADQAAQKALTYWPADPRATQVLQAVANRRQADQFVGQARLAIQQGRLDDALAALDQAARVEPGRRDIQTLIQSTRQAKWAHLVAEGQRLAGRGDFDGALRQYQAAAALLPGYGNIDTLLAGLQTQMAGHYLVVADQAFRAQQWGNALVNYLLTELVAPHSLPKGVIEDCTTKVRQRLGYPLCALVGAEPPRLELRPIIDALEPALGRHLAAVKPDSVTVLTKAQTHQLLAANGVTASQLLGADAPAAADQLKTAVGGIVLARISEFAITTAQTTGTVPARGQTGVQRVENPAYADALKARDAAAGNIAALTAQRNRLLTQQANLQISPPSATRDRTLADVQQNLTATDTQLTAAKPALDTANRTLALTPRQIDQPVLADVTIPVTVHTKTAKLIVAVQVIDTASGLVLSNQTVDGTVSATGQESAGDPAHHVPPQTLRLPDDPTLTQQAITRAIYGVQTVAEAGLFRWPDRFVKLAQAASAAHQTPAAIENLVDRLFVQPAETPPTEKAMADLLALVGHDPKLDLRAALASRCGLFRPAVRLPIQVEERDGLIWLKQFAGTAPPAVPPSLSLPAQIVALDGKPVHTVAALRWIANTFAPGSKVALDVASQASTQPARILLVVERVPQ